MASQFITTGIGHTLFSFDGRLARKPFWVNGIAIPTAVLFGYFQLSEWIIHQRPRENDALDGVIQAANVIVLCSLIAVFGWIWFAATTKRLHDRNMTGWYVWLFIVPYIGGYYAYDQYLLKSHT
jgi:uncharacterized membrane protein YhaH (DUF805 family)